MSQEPWTATLLACPGCQTPIERRTVNESQEIASCLVCRRVIDLGAPRTSAPAAAQVTAPTSTALAPAISTPVHGLARARARVPLPDEMSVVEEPGGTVVTWAPPRFPRLMNALGVGGATALLVLYFVARTWRTLVIPTERLQIIFGLIALATIYASLAAVLNRVRIVAGHRLLAIRVGPVPWPGSHALAEGSVRQLFGEVVQTPDEDGKIKKQTYTLSAVVGAEERRLRLLSGLTEVSQVLWLEQTLERALGIRNRPVGGELPTSGKSEQRSER